MSDIRGYGYDQTTDTYELNVDNFKEENGLDGDSTSCASAFSVTLDPSLDLAPLLYVRAVEAELRCSFLSVSGLPLSFTRSENADILLSIPVDAARCNRLLNSTTVTELNGKALSIQNADHVCPTPAHVIDYMNTTFRFHVNFLFISRYLRFFLDDDILPDAVGSFLTHGDIRLLQFYIDAALYTRNQLHLILCKYLQVTDDISAKIVYSTTKTTAKCLALSAETKLLAESECIIAIAERTQAVRTKTVDFTVFHEVNLNRSETLATLNTSISDSIGVWLEDLGFNLDTIDEETKTAFSLYLDSNKKLIEIGLLARNLLFLEKGRIDGRVRSESRLFQTDFFRMSLDVSGQRCVFSSQPKQFLAKNAFCTVYLPPRMSHSLGSDIDKSIILGPFTADMQQVVRPRLTNNITSRFQFLPCAIRNLPAVLHLTSDLACGKGSDTFLKATPFSSHHILFTYVVDESTVANRAIVTTDPSTSYFKVKQSHRLLERFNVSIMDENFRLVLFPTRTYTRIAFQIRPVGIE